MAIGFKVLEHVAQVLETEAKEWKEAIAKAKAAEAEKQKQIAKLKEPKRIGFKF